MSFTTVRTLQNSIKLVFDKLGFAMFREAAYRKSNHFVSLTDYYTTHLVPELADVAAWPAVRLHSVTVFGHIPLLHNFVYNC